MIATVVDWEALLDVVVASLAAGIGLTITFSLAIYGSIRLVDARRDGRPVEAAAFAALALGGLAVTLGAVVLGIVVMTAR